MVKNPPASAGATGDVGLIPKLGRSPLGGNGNMATHSSILAWIIAWTEEPGGLQPIGLQSQIQLKGTEHANTSG